LKRTYTYNLLQQVSLFQPPISIGGKGRGELIPRLQHQPPSPVLPIQPLLLLLQHPERLAREIGAVHVFGVEDVAQFIAGEAVEFGIVGVEFGAEKGAAS